MNKNEYLTWEAMSRDTIDLKRVYVDLAGDLTAGVLLSQIIYWHLPGSNGETKLQVKKGGHMWLAKSASNWWEECRIKPRQATKCLKLLEKKQLIILEKYKYNGAPTTHIRLNWPFFLAKINKLAASGEAEKPPEAPKTLDLSKSVKSICRNRVNPFAQNRQIHNKDYVQRLRTEITPPTPQKNYTYKNMRQNNDRASNVRPI